MKLPSPASLALMALVYLSVVASLLFWRHRLVARARSLHRRWSGRAFDGRTLGGRMDDHARRPLAAEAPSRDRSGRMEGTRNKIARMPFFRRREEPAGIIDDEFNRLG